MAPALVRAKHSRSVMTPRCTKRLKPSSVRIGTSESSMPAQKRMCSSRVYRATSCSRARASAVYCPLPSRKQCVASMRLMSYNRPCSERHSWYDLRQ